MKDVLKFIAALAVTLLAGVIGSIFTKPQINSWYASLAKPRLSPPGWIFAPVWTILFVLMGIALFLVWRQYPKLWNNLKMRRWWKAAAVLFLVQLVLNVWWSVIFFGQRNPAGAFIEIIVLELAILATIFVFSKISKPAAWLLLPYVLWVAFAGYLNFMIWQLNATVNLGGGIACTLEAKQCPDGSFVSRVLPACEFAPCP